MSAPQVAGAMEKAMKGVTYYSESDYPFGAVSASNPGKKPVSGELVMKQLKGDIEKFFKVDGNELKYEDLAFEMRSSKASREFVAGNTKPEDPRDPDQVRDAKAYQQLLKIVNQNLTDVRVVKIGAKGDDGKLATDQGLYALVLVGKTRDGQLAGLITGTVET